MLNKPISRQINLFDYTECSRYIFDKYNVSQELQRKFWQERLAPYVKNDIIYCLYDSSLDYDSLDDYMSENYYFDDNNNPTQDELDMVELVKIEKLFFTEFCPDEECIYLSICW